MRRARKSAPRRRAVRRSAASAPSVRNVSSAANVTNAANARSVTNAASVRASRCRLRCRCRRRSRCHAAARQARSCRAARRGAAFRNRPGRPERAERPIDRPLRLERPERPKKKSDDETETFRIEVGEQHGVKAANIVGAIANEAGLDSQYIGKIEINDDHSLVDLPSGMPRGVFRDLQKAWVLGRQMRISKLGDPIPPATPGPGPGGKRKPPRV
jgi:ATP-dependent RNA helicase DeaD